MRISTTILLTAGRTAPDWMIVLAANPEPSILNPSPAVTRGGSDS